MSYSFNLDPVLFDNAKKELEDVYKILCEANSKAIDKLTKEQFTNCILQALACGDFIRLVMIDSTAQAIIYIPYREREILLSRIKELEEEITLLKNAP